jgi:hypothetical protein
MYLTQRLHPRPLNFPLHSSPHPSIIRLPLFSHAFTSLLPFIYTPSLVPINLPSITYEFDRPSYRQTGCTEPPLTTTWPIRLDSLDVTPSVKLLTMAARRLRLATSVVAHSNGRQRKNRDHPLPPIVMTLTLILNSIIILATILRLISTRKPSIIGRRRPSS